MEKDTDNLVPEYTTVECEIVRGRWDLDGLPPELAEVMTVQKHRHTIRRWTAEDKLVRSEVAYFSLKEAEEKAFPCVTKGAWQFSIKD
jgi:hypothetical protein